MAIIDYFTFLQSLLTGERLRAEFSLVQRREDDVSSICSPNEPLHILDLANGRLRPQYFILQNQGHKVIGVDLANHPASDAFSLPYRFARWLYAFPLYGGFNHPPANTLTCGDVGKLPFASNCFDLVTSIAAFEHFLDIPSAVREVARVLRPGGIAHIGIHPFTALSGGHNVRLLEIPLRNLPKGVDAWDHLRQRRLPFHVPLNEWRIQQYLDEFSRHLSVTKHYCAMREGEHLLSREVLNSLPGYSADELTCGAYVIVAQKQANS